MTLFTVVHNIPSPYRLHLFLIMYRLLKERGVDFHAHFMAKSHAERPSQWHIDSENIPFPHTFWTDVISFVRKENHQHLNPDLIATLMIQQPDYLLVGGPWSTPTGICSSILVSAKTKIGWVEGNTKSPGKINGILKVVKSSLLKRFQYIAVPGQEGQQYVELILRGRKDSSSILFLPNVIDEQFFSTFHHVDDEVRLSTKEKFGLSKDKLVALCPARLSPEKGLYEFLSNISRQDLINWNVLIIGEGKLKEQLTELLNERHLSDLVKISPYISYNDMPALYAASDLFVLPSLSDPNPLSVVEAMYSGLPLLISNKIGNYPEALEDGVNGWGFDPLDKEQVKWAIQQAFGATRPQLIKLGGKSRERANIFWSSEKAISHFLDCLQI